MSLCVALLRGINVGGHKQVAMSELRALLAQLGFSDAQSLLQSGNLVFRTKTGGTRALEQLLEAETRKRLRLETAFFVRRAHEWQAIVAGNPLRAEAQRNPGHFLVMLLKDAPEPKAVKALQGAITGPEILRAVDRQLYITYPDGTGRSRLTNALIEKKLGTRGTARNWNTMLKLQLLTERMQSEQPLA